MVRTSGQAIYTAFFTTGFNPLDSLSPADERRLHEEIADFLNEGGGSSSDIKGTVLIKHGLDFIHRNLSPAQRQIPPGAPYQSGSRLSLAPDLRCQARTSRSQWGHRDRGGK
ncbi:MAG: hypothetical protein C7B43_20660 [Sulfobacillus benefaciens]|uniref:Uncharacterized protein n=1 Tax=Sulfobacillus benefaciens TaxID=453960 RepID=A0A2T2WK05_9FIRM|nr:MAG: hypothetical protein C7B43_20660 [Sulfobacillus benefaciens]HBQ93910.1 hypothetical protein [Sulfobacillus sp.]